MSRFAKITVLFFVLTLVFTTLSVMSAARATVTDAKSPSNYANVWIEAVNGKLRPSHEIREEKIIKLSNTLTDIDIDTHSTDVRIVPSADSNVHFVLTGRAQEMEASILLVKELPNKIEISLSSEMTGLPTLKQIENSIQFTHENLQLQVQLPTFSKISVKNKSFSGDFEAVDLSFENLKISSMAGDITITRVKAKTLNASSTSGDIDSTDSNLDTVTAESTSGNINFDSEVTDLKANSTSGDIGVIRQETDTASIVEAKTVSGNIELHSLVAADEGSLTARTVSGEIEGLSEDAVNSRPGQTSAKAVIGLEGDQFQLTTVSGDIEISDESQD